MENSSISSSPSQNTVNLAVIIVISIVVLAAGWYFFSQDNTVPDVEKTEIVKIDEVQPEPVIEQEIEQVLTSPIEELETVQQSPESEILAPEPVVIKLPPLAESDNWVKEKLQSLTWRKELLKLVIDENMVRRLVIFTDNFAQGTVAYKYTPLVKPQNKFQPGTALPSDNNNIQTWKWDDKSSQRFNLYVEFLRSVDAETLVTAYLEFKPLIDEAYAELGYPDSDFSVTLLDAINRVLDMELPASSLELVRPSVMYQFKNPDIEALPDAEKLMLRIGKENLLVIKSVLLEFSEKLSRKRNE